MEKISKSAKNKKIKSMLSFDSSLYELKTWEQNGYVCGIDEVGRGCFAGPVVTAAVILHPFATHPLLKDSKILTETKREIAAQWIVKNSWYSFGIQSAQIIDHKNIYQATKLAMKQALIGLLSQSIKRAERTHLVLIDAMPLFAPVSYPDLKLLHFPFGENRSISIAAASILAKVKRDALLKRLSQRFPHYCFEEHKGYGTKKHQEALQINGASLIHRTTFISKGIQKNEPIKPNNVAQASLFC